MQSAQSRSITFRPAIGTVAAVLAIIVSLAGCARFGFTDRVLLRVPSPDGQMVAVCQEVPEFDGPSFAVRLERPDGTVVRRLYETGDADACSEIAWARDGRTLAVLTAHYGPDGSRNSALRVQSHANGRRIGLRNRCDHGL